MKVKIKKLSENATLPSRGSEYAAGYDLYADEAITVPSHKTVKVHTGIAMAIPEGYFGAIYARSGLATKQGLRPANCVAVIDADYRGEILVPLHNDGIDTSYAKVINKGERIAQIVIQPYLAVEWDEVGELPETGRGEGGFGSTGK